MVKPYEKKIAKNFYFEEYFVSDEYPELIQKAYDKVKEDKNIIQKITHHAHNIAQPLRDHVCKTVEILSGYRDPFVNQAIGGSKTSDHMEGLAGDMFIPSKAASMDDMEELFRWCVKNLNYRQIIWYPQSNSKFIHGSINWPLENKPFKRQALVQWDGKYIDADEFFRKGYLD